MQTPNLMNFNTVNLNQIEALMDEGGREFQSSQKNKLRAHHQKIINHQNQYIAQLKSHQKNSWRGALFGFFTGLMAQGVQFINMIVPGLGTGLSAGISQLSKLNPFQFKAQDAQVQGEEFKQLAQQESASHQQTQEQIKKQQDHQQTQSKRLETARMDLQKSKEAALRV